jgi:hypothetical protein
MATVKGGDKLKRKLDALIAGLASGNNTVKVGFLSKATYPDGKPVAMIAAIQDFGAPSRGIPPRPFFRNMIRDNSKAWPGIMANLLATTNYDTDKTLNLMGEGIKGQLQQSIRDTNTPTLSPKTVARKGFSKPLIDTGHMINSVDWEIVRK